MLLIHMFEMLEIMQKNSLLLLNKVRNYLCVAFVMHTHWMHNHKTHNFRYNTYNYGFCQPFLMSWYCSALPCISGAVVSDSKATLGRSVSLQVYTITAKLSKENSVKIPGKQFHQFSIFLSIVQIFHVYFFKTNQFMSDISLCLSAFWIEQFWKNATKD